MAGKRIKKRIKKRPVKKRAKRKPVKTRVRRKVAVKKPKVKAKQKAIGIVTHYFPQVRAAVIKLKVPLSLGESVRIKGHTTDFTQLVDSLQIDRQPITKAKRGQEIGLLVDSRVRRRDAVYKA